MTKRLLLFLILALPCLAYSQEQDTLKKSKLTLTSVSFEMGRILDKYSNVDLDMMYDLTMIPSEIERDLVGYGVKYDHDVEGSRFGGSIALVPYSKKENDQSSISEIRLGLFYSQRATNLSYLFTDTSGGFRSVDYSTRFKELSLQTAYVWKYNPEFAKRFILHGGLGIGLGSTFKDKTSVAEIYSSGQTNEIPASFFKVYEGKSSFFGRVYTPIGINFALAERFDVGFESTFGAGFQQVYDGESYAIPFSWTWAIKASYFF